jgi:hypothetical protein
MPFNHYAKIKKILEQLPDGWFIKRIDEPTQAKNFSGETVRFEHYYRIYNMKGEPIKYCKFQQIDRLAQILKVSVADLPIVD